MSLTPTQINEAFAALGLIGPSSAPNAAPSAAVVASLEGISNNYTALNTIMALPEVQTEDFPVLAMFDLALGHDPTAATLSSIVETNLSQAGLASAFVSSQAFANVYNGGVLLNPNAIVGNSNSGIITALFLNGLGHAPTTATLNGFFGLTLSQAFLVFTQSNAVAVSATMNASLLNILELATGIPASVNPLPTQTLTLTVGQDTVASGATYHDPVLGAVTVLSTGNVTVDAPLAGVFGNQPTLTPADSVSLTGTGNVLDATFAGGLGGTVTGLNLVGLQTWNIQQTAFGTISLSGGPTNFLQGVSAINYNGNGFASSLLVGTAGFPILPTTGGTFNNFALSVANAPGFAGNGVDLAMSKTGFTGTETIDVTANTVGTNGIAYDIAAGSATIGFQTWNVASQGGSGITNNIALGGDGSSTATNIAVTDPGDGTNTTLWAAGISGSSAANWKNVTDINLSGTSGFVTITGAENGAAGLLSVNTALKTIEGGTGNSLYDLSGLPLADVSAAGFAIQGGTSTAGNSAVEFNNAVITGVTHLIDLTNISVLDDSSAAQGGTINMMWWAQQNSPGSGPGLIPLNTAFALTGDSLAGTVANGGAAPAGFQLLQLLSATSTAATALTSNLVIENGPADFAINMQGTSDTGGFNFTITQGPLINTTSMLDVWVGDSGAAGPAKVSIDNYTTTNVYMPHDGGITKLGTTSFTDTPVFTVTDATLNFNDNTADTGGAGAGTPDTLKLGNVYGGTGGAINGVFTDIGTTSVFLDASLPTTINDFGTGIFEIGGNDASVVDAASTSETVMFLPDSGGGVGGFSFNTDNVFLNHGVTVTGSLSELAGANLLQGSSGKLVLDTHGNGFIGGVASDVITGGHGADNIFGMGGNDLIHLNSAGTSAATDSTVWIGEYHEGGSPGTNFTQAITDIVGGGEIFTNFYEGSLNNITTVTGFVTGPAGDVIKFDPASWATGALAGGVVDAGLQKSLAGGVGAGDASLQLLTTPGTHPAAGGVDVILDGISQYAGQTAFNNALHQATVGDINISDTGVIINKALVHVLVAYSTGTGINIADVTMENTSGATQTADTANGALHVSAEDLVDLTGTAALGTLASHNIHFV